MQTLGEEQNFQTLFCELRLEDESLAPRFSVVWTSAQASTRSRHGHKLAFAAATVLLFVTLLSFALWLRDRSRSQQQNSAVVIPSASPAVSIAPRELEATPNQIAQPGARNRVNSMRRAMRLAERRRVRVLASRESEILNAAAVSSWLSPTALLMQSPADDVLIQLPQLYQSVTELNSFLPDTQKYKEK